MKRYQACSQKIFLHNAYLLLLFFLGGCRKGIGCCQRRKSLCVLVCQIQKIFLQCLKLSKQFLHYFEENDRPQPKLDRMLENGMAVSIGRLREDNQYDYKFVCLSHNTLRGAAGGAVLLAELLAAKGYFD